MRPGGRSGSRWGAGAAAPLHALRRTLQDPRLLRLQLAWSLVVVASWTVTVALAVVAYDAGGTPAVALVVLARTLPGLLAGPVLGTLIDRTSATSCLAAAAVLGALASAGAALAGGSVVAVVLLGTVVAVATMVVRAAQSTALPELVDDPAELTAANVLSSAIEATGVFAGPALAGLLLAVSGAPAAFGTASAMLAGAALLLARRPSRRGRAPRRAAPRTGGGSRALLRLPAARLLLLLVIAQTVLAGALVVLYPALAVDVLEVDPSAVGLLTAAFGLGGVLASVGLFALAGSRRLGLLTAGALLLWTLPLLVVPLLPDLLAVGLLLGVVGGGNALFDVTVVTLLQRAVPPALLGRAFGWLETAVVLGVGLGAAAAAPLEEGLGASVALAGLAGLLLAVALGVFRPLRRLDTSLTAPARQVAVLRALPPFALLPTLEVERLALRLERLDVVADEVVVRQGEPGTTYYVVEQGDLEVDVDGAVVTHLHQGDAFGEVALLREGVRTATVTARTRAALWSLDGAVFLAALQTGGGRSRAALDEVARTRLRRAAPRDVLDPEP